MARFLCRSEDQPETIFKKLQAEAKDPNSFALTAVLITKV